MATEAPTAIAVAERLERTGGPRAGLAVWKALSASSTTVDVRARALLAALRCAVTIGDLAAVDELAAQWGAASGGVWDGAVASLCTAMARAGHLRRAISLADAEARRHPTARALYCHARCLDVAGDESAAPAFRDAIVRAEREGRRDIALAARVRRAVILSRSWRTMGDAVDEARSVDVSLVPAASRVSIARVLLRSPSRFTRATALGILDDVVTGADEPLARRALAVVGGWFDEVGAARTPLEEDRLVALLGRERVMAAAPTARDVVRVVGRIANAGDDDGLAGAMAGAARLAPELAPLHARARDILRGRFEATKDPAETPPSDLALRRAFRYSEMLDVVVALRDRAPERAARALRSLADAEEAGERLPAEVLELVQGALSVEDGELRAALEPFMAARLRTVRGGPPSRGFLGLANLLVRLGMTELAVTACRAAVVGKETGAAHTLGTLLAREGWDLAKSGNRMQAIGKLREARALLEVTA
ncbi:MAG TPA: hypothetical protein VM925_36780 [Labilithrix sp.]|nr:hypothetical protein [Labilithrix sp.]